MNTEIKLTPYDLIRSETGPEIPLFGIRLDTMRNPRNNYETKRLLLESTDWVNVVPVRSDGKLVMIYQYRSGIGEITIEVPGGIVERDEDSFTAAQRELMEETGYSSQNWSYLGAVQPKPAIHNHLCHHWLALDVEKTDEMALGAGEDIQVVSLTVEEVRGEFIGGRLRHALALSALSRVPVESNLGQVSGERARIKRN